MVILALVGMIAFFAYAIVPLGRATDEASTAKTAADAAALAGAEDVRSFLLVRTAGWSFASRDELFDMLRCDLGRSAAEAYARRNGAMLREYCYDPFSDRIEASVAMRDAGVGGEAATATSTASVGWALRSCRWEDDPIPPPVPEPGPIGVVGELPPIDVVDAVPVPDVEPPVPPGTTLRCRGSALRFDVDGSGMLKLVPPGRLRAMLVVRLDS